MKLPKINNLLRKYTKKTPVIIDGFPDAHNVWLVVDQQSFCTTPDAMETAEDAERCRLMLAKAIKKIIDSNQYKT